MSEDEKRGYSRGYAAGRKHAKWPEHRPPAPPTEAVAKIMQAAIALRDECDAISATLFPDDDFVRRLDPRIQAMDEALAAVTSWLLAATQGDSHDR